MRTMMVALVAMAALFVSGRAAGVSAVAAHTDSNQTAYFYGLPANAQFLVTFTAYHYEGDPYPYTLGTNAYSNSVGTAKAIVALDSLAAFYNGSDGPVYEVRACINTTPVQCTPDTYVGYYPESLWYYSGG